MIGTHGHSHRMLTKLSYEEQLNDIKASKEHLESITGQPIRWFRPPFGLFNEDTMRAAQKLHLNMVLWQVASWDWMHQKDEEKILDNVLEYVEPGDIILLHELPQTVNVLPQLIHGIQQKGLELDTPHSMLKLGDNLKSLKKPKTSQAL
jgi:peptidoglycan/xylan/chitin deacetylase (PgdA/CDA1 family)